MNWKSYVFCFLMMFVYSPAGHAGETIPTLKVLEAQELSLDVRQVKIKRDPYYPNKDDWYSYVGLNWNIDLLGPLYWNNRTFFYGDRSQVRKIGWHYDLGLHLSQKVDFYWHHESEHDADHARIDPEFPGRDKFPIENSFGIRVNFLKK